MSDHVFSKWELDARLADGRREALFRMSELWGAQVALLEAERDLLVMQKAMLQRRVRKYRRR
eukprot:1114807-Prymnesium_polylepis.2